jgi:hypothetical protein
MDYIRPPSRHLFDKTWILQSKKVVSPWIRSDIRDDLEIVTFSQRNVPRDRNLESGILNRRLARMPRKK